MAFIGKSSSVKAYTTEKNGEKNVKGGYLLPCVSL
jgi:hypothetical protein